MKGVIIDFEGFILSKNFVIYRQLAYVVLDEDKGECINIFTPGVYYNQLSLEEKATVRFATQKLHGLRMAYHPQDDGTKWIHYNQIDDFLTQLHELYGTIYYKGGTLERDYCNFLEIPCVDMANEYGVQKAECIAEKFPNHDEFVPHCCFCDVSSYKKALLL